MYLLNIYIHTYIILQEAGFDCFKFGNENFIFSQNVFTYLTLFTVLPIPKLNQNFQTPSRYNLTKQTVHYFSLPKFSFKIHFNSD